MTIKQLLDDYGSNKGVTYEGLYDVLFGPIRSDIKMLIEIGIGTMLPGAASTMFGFAIHGGYRPGGSLKAWRDYLPNAFIYGVDVQPDTQFTDTRITTFQWDSTTPQVLFNKGIADVIVDDGLHHPNAQVATMRNFMPVLKPGGLYVLEDIFPSSEKQIREAIPSIAPDCSFFFVRPAPGCDWLACVIRK